MSNSDDAGFERDDSSELTAPHAPPREPEALSLATQIRRRRRNAALLIGAIVVLVAIPALLVFTSRGFQLAITPEDLRHPYVVHKERGVFFVFRRQVLLLTDEAELRVTAPGYRPVAVPFSKSQLSPILAAHLEPMPGLISIEVNTSHAIEVRLDDEPLSRQQLLLNELPSGSYDITVSGTRIQTLQTEIEVVGYGESQTFAFEVLDANATLKVSATPANATISVDGSRVAQGIFEGPIGLGPRELVVEAPGYFPESRTVSAQPNQQLDVGAIALRPMPAKLTLLTKPPAAAVFVADRFVGESPVTVEVGALTQLEIRARKANFETRTVSVTLGPGEAATRELDLNKMQLTLNVTASETANVMLNGIAQGNTPLTLSASVGDRVVVSKPGFQTLSKVVEPTTKQELSFDFTMLSPRDYAYSRAPDVMQTSQGVKLVKFPPVRFEMVSRIDPDGREPPQTQTVEITRPYYLGISEVTVGAFERFDSRRTVTGSDRIPITDVSWSQAAQFCNWLSDQDNQLTKVYQFNSRGALTGYDAAALGYRLPTEIEWEAAAAYAHAQGSYIGRFPWGDRAEVPFQYANLAGRELKAGRYLVNHSDAFVGLGEVESHSPNTNGVYDLAGNASEWVHDFYTLRPTNLAPDSMGPKSGTDHVIKGSNFGSYQVSELYTHYRSFVPSRSDKVGFRVARWIY